MDTIKVKVLQTEKDIVAKLSQGVKSENVGAELNMAPGSFATLLKDLRVKYGCKNTTHLVATFLREGLIK